MEEFLEELYKNDKQYQILHNPFSIETHRKTFVNYLEVVILEDGTVEYAVPSHQEKGIQMLMKRFRFVNSKEAWDSIPRDYWFDIFDYMNKKLGVIFVWNDFYKGTANDTQKEVLFKLKENGLYLGCI